MSVPPVVAELVARLHAEGKPSPDGHVWHQFFEFLRSRKGNGHGDPPVPLILAAAGESNAAKLERLRQQLVWAGENGCLDEAMAYLEQIPPAQWNRGSSTDWERTFY